MKNSTFLMVCFIAISFTLNAQQKYFYIGSGLGTDSRAETLFEKRIASLYLGGESNKRILKMTDEKINFVSFGWYFNSGLWKYDFLDFDEDTDLTSARASVGIRLNLRLLHLLDHFATDTDVAISGLDVYGGINLGPEFSYYIDFDAFETRFFIAPFFGARYLLTDSFGVFAELGNTNYALLNLGITFGSNNSTKD